VSVPNPPIQVRNRLWIIASREAKNEVNMYNPFVLACNYALETLSEIDVHRLPKFSEEKQPVFVHNHDIVCVPKWDDNLS
jgi:hypothetical protein